MLPWYWCTHTQSKFKSSCTTVWWSIRTLEDAIRFTDIIHGKNHKKKDQQQRVVTSFLSRLQSYRWKILFPSLWNVLNSIKLNKWKIHNNNFLYYYNAKNKLLMFPFLPCPKIIFKFYNDSKLKIYLYVFHFLLHIFRQYLVLLFVILTCGWAWEKRKNVDRNKLKHHMIANESERYF